MRKINKDNLLTDTSPTIPIQQGVDPDYLVNILTKDISTIESILELVDNAVDAARDSLLANKRVKLDKYGLPAKYNGYQIHIRFGKQGVTFVDNCSGISEEVLSGRAFVIGAMSEHSYGIGRFGIGLKRALFRLGTRYSLRTDTGSFAAKMRFNSSHLQQADLTLQAYRRASTGQTYTLIRISHLRDDVNYEFNGSAWNSNLSTVLSRRYGLYIAKGFQIFINGKAIDSFGPDIRDTKFAKEQTSTFMVSENVRVFIDAGMHEDYRFKFESDYDKQIVGNLTDQYGWYFVCNDRIVEVATHEKDLGWLTRWHQEYYGFIGWVRFTAKDAEHLPWNTKKSNIDPHSLLFHAVATELQQFAEVYKARNKLVRTLKGCPEEIFDKNGINLAIDTQQPSTSNNPSASAVGMPTAIAPKPQVLSVVKPKPNDHNENWKTLLPHLNIDVKHQKIRALVYEAMNLDVSHCYAGSMLFRSIVEIALFEHLKSTKSFRDVRQMVFDQAVADDRAFTDSQKKNFRPNFTQVLEWLNKNDSYFPDDVRRDCVTARNKFGKHLKELNGIVHEGDLTNSGKLVIVRNDTMPLLNFLLLGV